MNRIFPRSRPAAADAGNAGASILALLSAAILALPGCNIVGFFAGAAMPTKVPARYQLDPARPALVLVDDPRQQLGGPAMTAAVAGRIGFELTERRAAGPIVEQRRLADLASVDPQTFARMPLDAVGRAVGAGLVIHVVIEATEVGPEPGIIQPAALVWVRVIDAEHRRRLFPPLDDSAAGGTRAQQDRGLSMTIKLRGFTTDDGDPAKRSALAQRLADKIGLEVARLFYEYEKDPPGQVARD